MASSSSNVVGVHYRVGKKIGEGSFGVIFEGTNLLNNQQVAIKFVSNPHRLRDPTYGTCYDIDTDKMFVVRNRGRAMHHS
jgi:casein kinase 1